jgi:tetratricopeptide (TPR) repeat protein
MKHHDWHQRVKEAVRLGQDEPGEAAKRLLELAEEIEPLMREHLSEWHVVNTLVVAASLLERAGDLKRAAEVFARIVEIEKDCVSYHGRSLANSLAELALRKFRVGDRDEAAALTEEALKWLGQFPDSSPVFEKVMQGLRKYRQQKHNEEGDNRS